MANEWRLFKVCMAALERQDLEVTTEKHDLKFLC